jgi:hypothetical protein
VQTILLSMCHRLITCPLWAKTRRRRRKVECLSRWFSHNKRREPFAK